MARFAELEQEIVRVKAERDAHAAAIEDELARLSDIYERMTSDIATLRQERDRAMEAAREERERRARETLELSERLDQVLSKDGQAGGAVSPEAFVQARLSEPALERRPLAPGETPTVYGYKVAGPIGQGGMATVYHATCEKDGREVAIKILHEGPDASNARLELFLREAAVMLQLSHPGLVRALDAGDCPHGRYLVLELVRGESLAGLVRRCGPLPEKEALRVGLQVARALAYCARLGLTHRDVKPSNLLLDTTGRVRLCDFGLAALSHGNDPARPYGSPGYAAPEQISNPTSVDERVDIYALGATLWHLVVGRRAFSGSAKDVFETQRTQDVSDPRFEGADISPRLAQVIRRMGRASRDRRYRRWDECILDLMLVENGNPPFAAHLAEAQEPGSPVLALGGELSPSAQPAAAAPTPGGAPPSSASPSAPIPPALDPSMSHRDLPVLPPSSRGPAQDGWPPVAPDPSSPRAPADLRERSTWLVVGAVALLGLAVGYAVTHLTRPTPFTEILTRVEGIAAEGRPADAARAARSAADLFDGEDRARLIRLAERLETR